MKINVVTNFSYTIETLFHAREHRLKVASVPVRTNHTVRPSRLFRSIPVFLTRSVSTVLRTCLMTRPLLIFGMMAGFLFVCGMAPVIRFLVVYFSGDGTGKIQSLILGAVFLGFSGMSLILGVFAELLSYNRILIQRCLQQQRLLSEDLQTARHAFVRGPGL